MEELSDIIEEVTERGGRKRKQLQGERRETIG
jgi:hypothetical protein